MVRIAFLFTLKLFFLVYNQEVYAAATKPSLRLESAVEGKTSLYPGEETKLVYRYYFSGNIALTSETLPLLKAEGLIKIGEVEIKDYTKGDISVREISQIVQADKIGEYSYGPSQIEGVTYEKSRSGQPVPTSEKMISKTPPVTILVLPFPELNRPASFEGAIGQFSFNATLKGGNKVFVGDEISLILTIDGKGNLERITPPDIMKQPGFRGFFKTNSLPPQMVLHGEKKEIEIKIRPLTDEIKEIPSVEFSYFDPEAASYVIIKSNPISLDVVKPSSPKQQAPSKLQNEPKMAVTAPPVVAIEPIYQLDVESLYNKLFGTWWVMAIFPFGVILIVYQFQMRDFVHQESIRKRPFAGVLMLNSILGNERGTPSYYLGISKALKQTLYDCKLIESVSLADDDIPQTGLAGLVAEFLAEINRQRFAENFPLNDDHVGAQARRLVEAIYGERVSHG